MSSQKSFIISHKLNDNVNETCNNVQFDAHINVWNINNKGGSPFIDIGLKIKEYKNVESICFAIPFKVEDNDLIDLSHILKEEEIQLIFNNTKYKYRQINNTYVGYDEGTDNETVLIFNFKYSSDNRNLSYTEFNNNIGGISELKIHLSKCNDIKLENISALYIRFRIKNIDFKSLLSTLPAKSNYLESAFTERQILDFKLNNARTIDKFYLSDMTRDDFSLISFNTIHLFLMVPTDYEVTNWGPFSECRQLEKNEWNRYLMIMDDDNSENNISAYHWKIKDKSEEFAQLIKMEHKATNKLIIFMYCLVAVGLGILSSIVYDLIKCLLGFCNGG